MAVGHERTFNVKIQCLGTSRAISDILAAPFDGSRFMSEESPHSVSVDARGERCPMPLLMAKRALREVPSGGVLEVLSTDAGSERDFESFARLAGHRVQCTRRDDDVLCLTITKA